MIVLSVCTQNLLKIKLFIIFLNFVLASGAGAEDAGDAAASTSKFFRKICGKFRNLGKFR